MLPTISRRRALGLSLATLLLAGCDPNPNGPTFPDAPKDAEGGAEGGVSPKGGPAGKGRRKAGPAGTIGDPAL